MQGQPNLLYEEEQISAESHYLYSVLLYNSNGKELAVRALTLPERIEVIERWHEVKRDGNLRLASGRSIHVIVDVDEDYVDDESEVESSVENLELPVAGKRPDRR